MERARAGRILWDGSATRVSMDTLIFRIAIAATATETERRLRFATKRMRGVSVRSMRLDGIVIDAVMDTTICRRIMWKGAQSVSALERLAGKAAFHRKLEIY